MIQAHEELLSAVTCLHEYLARMKCAFDQSCDYRKQLRKIVDHLQRADIQASTALAQFCEQMNRLTRSNRSTNDFGG